MLKSSPQVIENLRGYLGRAPSAGASNGSSLVFFWQCLVLVSDAVQIPANAEGIPAYIQAVLNGSDFGGGTTANQGHCLGIVANIPSMDLVNTDGVFYNGNVDFVAKNTGTIGSAIMLPLYGNSTTDVNTFIQNLWPLTNESLITAPMNTIFTTQTQEQRAQAVFGTTQVSPYLNRRINNYTFLTDSVGTSTASVVAVESLAVTKDLSYTYFGSSLKLLGN